MENEALLVIDVQNDFCNHGQLAVPNADSIVPLINTMMEEFQHVILTQDWHPANHSSFASTHAEPLFSTIEMPYGPQILWPDHCIQDTWGAEFHPQLETIHAEAIIRKGYRSSIDSYSAFFENDHATPTGLYGYLQERNIHKVTLCGLATDFCVGYSALDAISLGLETHVKLSACRAIDQDDSLNIMLKKMQNAGVKILISL